MELSPGVSVLATYTGEAAADAIGGLRRGARYADQILFGADVDLAKAADLPDASLHGIAILNTGHSLSNDVIGNSIPLQAIYGGGQTYRLSYLTWEQRWPDDGVTLEIGRMPGETAFLSSFVYCRFQNNDVCGSPYVAVADTSFTESPIATWAGVVKTRLQGDYFLDVGAYETVPSAASGRGHGVDFLATATGYNVPFEVGYATSLRDDAMPRHYGVGAIIDRSPFSIPASGSAPAQTSFGRVAVYQRFEQVVYKPQQDQQRALTLFGLAIERTRRAQSQEFGIELGASYLGPLEDRPFDSLSFVASMQRLSDIGIAGVRAARIAQGLSTSDIDRSQIFLEANYGIQLGSSVQLTPNVQYIIGPDQLRYPTRPSPIPNALVIGARISVDLFTLAGSTHEAL